MSFTITCNECGMGQEFKEQEFSDKENIQIHSDGVYIVFIYCGNEKCKHGIELRM